MSHKSSVGWLVQGRTAFWHLVLVGCCLVLGVVACGEPPTSCSSDTACSGRTCVQGKCVDVESASTQPDGSSTDKATNESSLSDAGANPVDDNDLQDTARPESSADEEQTEPTPSCSETPPTCKTGGVCDGAKPECKNNKWVCSYPSDYEEQETRCDGKDNDCDGKVDEDITRPCYGGPSGTQGVGDCKAGMQLCFRGEWAECKDEVKPTEEVCDDKDNNCDGKVDELWPEKGGSCAKGVGGCRSAGQNVCTQDGQQIECNAVAKPPSNEVCDNVDNDCDGQVDEEVKRSCYTGPAGTRGIGTCKDGEQVCQSGTWGACKNDVKPSVETCDNKDNNCDGQIDNGLQRTCYDGPAGTKGVGPCKSGTQTCAAGSWGSCKGQVIPAKETCNGVDEDCSGTVDDGTNICNDKTRTCSKAKCICDTAKRYYPMGNVCVTDGDTCPSVLATGGQLCLDNDLLAVCDPYGKVGVLKCSGFTGKGCKKVAPGVEGCLMPATSYNQTSCLNLASGYVPQKSWQAALQSLGPNASSAVGIFNHCVGSGKSFCGTIVTSAGNQTTCMCSERSKSCNVAGQTKTLYDISYYDTTRKACVAFFGTRFGCPAPLNSFSACTKGNVSGFASYACQ